MDKTVRKIFVVPLINFERKKICFKICLKKFAKNKNFPKVRDYCQFTGKYRGAAQNICNFRFNEFNEIPVVFHNESNHFYYFIIKELANESESQFECFKENTEKCKTISFP